MKTTTILKVVYWMMIVCTLGVLAIVELFAMESAAVGALFGDAQTEFVCQSVMILLTLAVAYVATKFSKFKWIERKMREGTAIDYQNLSACRIGMIGFTIMFNIMGYMLFVNSSFVWLAVILYMTFPFVYPSKERYESETGRSE